VNEIEASQQRVGGDLGGAQDVASAVGFGLTEPHEFSDTAIHVAPDPAMNRCEHSIEPRRTNKGPRRTHSDPKITSVRLALRVTVELAFALIGTVLIAWAVIANQAWFDRHFLPAFFVSRQAYVEWQWLGRAGAAMIGATLALVVRPRAGRFVMQHATLTFNIVLAIIMAIGASEMILRQLHRHAMQEEPAGQEPRRRLDSQLGWTFAPARAARQIESGRVIEYAFDPAGYRVRSREEAVDSGRPTILFTGESMIVGEGLTWDESVPAQTGAMLGIQSANLAVSAYANDQSYLRLRSELPHFRQPVAVVSLFTPTLFDRNMDDDRPHLAPGLVWRPAVERWRLLEILRLVVRYRKAETIERGIGVTRDVLRATCNLAEARGAVPVIVVPQFTPEEPDERELRNRVLDGANLPVVRVELDGGWRIPGDGHPDARAAHAIATAIATRLQPLAAR
jgi:hypothetical protein